MKKTMILASVAMLSNIVLVSNALAQNVDQKYVDQIGDMTIAVTASQLCDNVSLNEANFQAQGAALNAEAKADGMSDEDIDNMMKSFESNPELLTQAMISFGEKHSVAPSDVAGFCEAVIAEKSAGSTLGKMVQ